MVALIIIVVLLALGFWHAGWTKAADEEQARLRKVAYEAETTRAELDRVEQRERDWVAWEQDWTASSLAASEAENRLTSFTADHLATLLKKERQLTFADDYGRYDNSGFIKELEYFVERVVPEIIREPHIKHHGEHVTLMMVVTVQICLLKRQERPSSGFCYTRDMGGVEFERLVAERLTSVGANVSFTPATGDQGADLIVDHNGETIVVQCKRSASTVGNRAVQEAYAGRKFHDAEQAWVVSDAPFSRAARQLANSLSVRLVDFDQVESAL